MKLTSKGFPITSHQLTKSLEMMSSFILRVLTQTITFMMMMEMSSKQKAKSLSKLRPRQIKWQNEVQEASPGAVNYTLK